MKAKTILFIFLTVSAISGTAQNDYVLRNLADFMSSKKIIRGEFNNELTESDISGSAYLNKEFINGTIYTVQKEKFANVPLRYNVYSDEMEFKNQNEEILAIAVPEIIKKIDIGDITFRYIPYLAGQNVKNGYFELITDGKASLYIRHEIIFKDAEKAGAYKDPSPPSFIKNPNEYYIQVGENAATLVKNKKSLPEIFPDNQDKIETFIKKNKTKTNELESIAELVNYYNSL